MFLKYLIGFSIDPNKDSVFPYEQWMQAEWQDYFREINCPVNIPSKSWYRCWSLAILQHWWRTVS